MGVTYKLKAEIKDFIIEKKKLELNLSCRQISVFILDKFQFKISKSSVNSIMKSAGLSMPIGRRRKKIRRKLEIATQPKEEIKLLASPVEEPVLELPVEIPVEKSVEKPIAEPQEIPPEVPIEPPQETLTEKPQEPPVEPSVEVPVVLPVEIAAESSVEMAQEIAQETEGTGAILLKAADCLVSGSQYITETIRNRLSRREKELLAKTESLIYLPLFRADKGLEAEDFLELWPLVGKKFSLEAVLSYLAELQAGSVLSTHILRTISYLFQEVRCIKVVLSDGSIFYLDGQLHTIWSIPQIPYDFSTTIYNINSYINKYLYENKPFILFNAPGYDTPTKEFFDFILSLEAEEKQISQLMLYDNKLEEIKVMPIEKSKKRYFIFGLWSWQFGQYRKVKINGEFVQFYFEGLKKNFYIAPVELELLQPNISKRVILRGVALKAELNEKIRLIILSNFPAERRGEEIIELYLSHWPNLEEGFQDFSRKIELFTYTAAAQRFFSLELTEEDAADISGLLNCHLQALDLYARWHFFPSGYEDKNFPTIKEQFYNLKARFKREAGHIFVTFQPPAGYANLKDLAYVCRRINEREIVFPDGNRLWCDVEGLQGRV